ncbi:hypothetical protein Pyn_29754 [Prunus yedoensis var. nudiflora]|uniref:Uncharacterized protein n=1 Tax=Prunus yedoensis var. nudiflora TaxID=2094558 RepID=A0A314YPL5_PRUYE|nr:hypothetical protein Pyn_29754 [Prunus yedoensis var. nudiflora]
MKAASLLSSRDTVGHNKCHALLRIAKLRSSGRRISTGHRLLLNGWIAEKRTPQSQSQYSKYPSGDRIYNTKHQVMIHAWQDQGITLIKLPAATQLSNLKQTKHQTKNQRIEIMDNNNNNPQQANEAAPVQQHGMSPLSMATVEIVQERARRTWRQHHATSTFFDYTSRWV